MQPLMIWRFNHAHQSFNISRLIVYSSMTPSMSLRKRVMAGFHELLKRSRRGEWFRLGAQGRELRRNLLVVALGNRDHFQGQLVEMF